MNNLSRLLTHYGMLAVLLLLCVWFSWATFHREQPAGREGGEALAQELLSSRQSLASAVIVVPVDEESRSFADALSTALTSGGSPLPRIEGDPPAVRQTLETRAREGKAIDLVLTTPACQDWTLFDSLRRAQPSLAQMKVRVPAAQSRSTFLAPSNLRNIADQIAVIAIIAVGMTMVILTGGVDLSVGSLVALSAVFTAWMLRSQGGASASIGAMLTASLAAILLCGAVGGFSGLMITLFRVPPFIATLAMMQVGSGLAFMVSKGQSLYDIPDTFTGLGRGALLASLPNAVLLMILIYIVGHILMTRTATGRHIYAVGGSSEAARLSGVRTKSVLLFVYIVSGLMAGIGGVITASQLKAGAPTYGTMYELYVIAAVVVGGTSLSGGEGRIFGTLVGAFIIAVIRNGMNLTNVEPYTQKVVLGLFILGAVLLDQLKHRRWRLRRSE